MPVLTTTEKAGYDSHVIDADIHTTLEEKATYLTETNPKTLSNKIINDLTNTVGAQHLHMPIKNKNV